MKKNKVKVSFSVQPEDVRAIAASSMNHIIERFKKKYIKNVELIATNVAFEKGEDILEAIENMFDDIDKTSQEFEDITSLLLEIKDTIDRPVPPAASLPPSNT